jgi:predicted transcriptional regulator
VLPYPLLYSKMGKPHTNRQIRERREKIMILLGRGYNQMDIAEELGITRMTLNRDMHYINEMNSKGLFGLAKDTFATMYYNCVEGCNEILRECWKIYKNVENDPRITQWHKIAALRLATEIHDKKFTMFQNGPATMHLGQLRHELDELKKQALGDNYVNDRFEGRSLNYRDLELDKNDLGKP